MTHTQIGPCFVYSLALLPIKQRYSLPLADPSLPRKLGRCAPRRCAPRPCQRPFNLAYGSLHIRRSVPWGENAGAERSSKTSPLLLILATTLSSRWASRRGRTREPEISAPTRQSLFSHVLCLQPHACFTSSCAARRRAHAPLLGGCVPMPLLRRAPPQPGDNSGSWPRHTVRESGVQSPAHLIDRLAF